MPNNLSDAEENRLLDLSLINGDLLALTTTLPTDAAGGTEVTGGSYARQALAYAAAASGSKASNAALLFTVLPATDVVAWEIYDSTGAARKWYGLFSPLSGTAQNTGDTVTITAHGLTLNQKIVFQTNYTPTGLTAGVTYFARTILTNTFQVATTAGGAAVAITADSASTGSIVVGKVQSFNAGDAMSVASGAVVCALS